MVDGKCIICGGGGFCIFLPNRKPNEVYYPRWANYLTLSYEIGVGHPPPSHPPVAPYGHGRGGGQTFGKGWQIRAKIRAKIRTQLKPTLRRHLRLV